MAVLALAMYRDHLMQSMRHAAAERWLTAGAPRETFGRVGEPMVAPVAVRRSGGNVGPLRGNLAHVRNVVDNRFSNGRGTVDHMRHITRFIQHYMALLGRKCRGQWLMIQAVWHYTGSSK